jgi:hypothetical protein
VPGALSQEMVATRRVRTPARRYDPSADAGRPQWTRADAGGDTDGSGSGGGDDSRRRASSARMASSPGVAASPRSPSPATARADWRQESDVGVADDARDSSEPASDVSDPDESAAGAAASGRVGFQLTIFEVRPLAPAPPEPSP